MKKTSGIHHITAIVGHPQENVDFYAGILGLRLVKQTVNFDDPSTYHLYFGDRSGKPGTIVTFFPWTRAPQGKIGTGQVGITSYVVPKGSLSFWKRRLGKFDIPYVTTKRFGDTYLQFNDPHGLQLEIVEREEGEINSWTFGDVTPEVGIKGFNGAVLFSRYPDKTAALLEKVMGLKFIEEDGEFIRLRSSANIGNIIDLKTTSIKKGQMGVGTVHHIAWRAIDEHDQLQWRKKLVAKGYHVTPVLDRNYFKSIYFQEHGGILFEMATDTPGFSHDESKETMGQQLKLPSQFEQYRERLKRYLPPFQVRDLD